jgi:Ca2+-transporting ATPase
MLLASNKKITVLRDGKLDQVSSWDLVVGDLLALSAGDEIAADGIFLRAGK